MKKWVVWVGGVWVLAGACVMRDEGPLLGNTCEETRRECNVGYSGLSGYFRTCSTSQRPCYGKTAEDDEAQGGAGPEEEPSEESAPRSPRPAGDDVGVATPADPTRYSAFDIDCERDSQCGPGKCIDGDCYYGCHSDAQCGSGDRCAVESGIRICLPDPNPKIECTRAPQCGEAETCLNGSCRQTCSSTEECTNVLDRCVRGICEPDRRPLSECVLNIECQEGFVCIDGACVAACPAGTDGGACIQEGRGGDLPAVLDPPRREDPASPPPGGDVTDDPAPADEEDEAEPEPLPEADAGAGDLPEIQ